ncbi:unnamed protein product [Meganyctiphanes norvegica]|uniref:Reverse transcriptase domain-containing protein n=1 Tax=Meganyctiphanes norvegica TaxID=48144 RepID=A0AAV2QWG4_MEGNR
MCNGLLLRFHSPPPLTIYPPESSAANPSQIPTIRSFIPDLLSRGVLRRILSPQPLFYSRLFLVRKKDGPFRLVIDLSRLNKCLEVPTFRMETVSSIASGIIQELWGCTIDLQDAFFNVPVSWVFHKYLAFILDGAVYVFQYLPFGLAVAPWAFSRVVRPIKGHCHLLGIRLHSYLDDFIVLQLSRQALRRDTSTILDLFQSLAIAVNVKKSHLTPSQTVEYLGVIFHLDTLTLSLTSSKVQSISSLCNSLMHSSCQSRRELEHLIGVLNFASYLVPLGRLRLRPLVSWMNSNTSTSTRDLPVPLGAPFKSALRMWLDKDYLRSHVPTFVPPPSLQLMTDASLTGWSGVLLPLSVSGYWPPSCTGSPIHWLELMAVMLSLQHFVQQLQGNHVLVMSDNTITVSCLLHQGSYRSETMMSLTRDILEFCQLHFITLVPKHLSGNLNVFADQESRIGPIATEWSLDPSTFQWLSDLAGPFQVDLFATRDNAQLQEFVSPFPDPLAVGINAFSLHWNDWTSIFLFPPVKVLHRVVSFLCQYRGQGILVAPYFAPSGWFPSLLQRAPDPVPLPESHSLSQLTREGRVLHCNPSVYKLHAWRL